jgi:glycosyltransferase involved in cell wall biosynthesis
MSSGKQQVDVSMLVANYNNGRYLDAFMQSVVDSTVWPAELILVDDGSTDNSLDILQKYSHLPFLKLVILEENVGFCNALNAGLPQCRHTFTMRVDPDDVLHPQRIERQYNFLKSHPEYDLLGHNAAYFDESPQKVLFTTNFQADEQVIRKRWPHAEYGVLHGTVMVKTGLFRQYPYEQQWVGAEDYHVFARMSRDGARMMNQPDCLTYVRIHPNSVTNDIPVRTVERIFKLQELIFEKPQPRWYFWATYYNLKYYRRFLACGNPIKKYLYLALAAMCRPDRVWRKIRSSFA